MSDFHSPGGSIVGLAGVAFRSFVGTFAVVFIAGCLLGSVSYFFLRDHPLYGLIAATVAVIESLATGLLLGGKRAIAMTLVHGFSVLGLGRRAVRAVFANLLGVSTDQEFGERGGWIGRGLERLPLAEAEVGLGRAVRTVVNAKPAGWFRPRLEDKLLRMVSQVTLARFRREDAKHGGVDLAKVRGELESQIDDLLVARLKTGLNRLTLLVLLGLPLTVAVQSYILILVVNAK